MNKNTKKVLALRLTKLLHALVATALFGLCWMQYYDAVNFIPERAGYLAAGSAVFFVLLLLFARVYDMYAIGSARVSHIIYSHGLAFVILDIFIYVVAFLISFRFINPLPIIILFVCHMAWSVIWSIFENWLYFKVSPPRKTVIIYTDESELYKLDEMKRLGKKFDVINKISVDVGEKMLFEQIENAEIVFLISVESELKNSIIKECIPRNVQCYVLPRVSDIIMRGADRMHTFSVPFLRVQKVQGDLEYLLIKRAFDIIASLLAIIILSPAMLIIAIAIKIQDGGSVLYKQTRLTKDGKLFKVLKFRSMIENAEKDGVARLSTENDDRITPVGKVIRKIRFDELPQLFNILKGDMTFVGPRPERPEIAQQYEKEIPSFSLRLQVKAGLTGYAQVYGRYNTAPYEKLKMDLMYINNMSLGEDIKLMFATVKILFMSESTEGVAQGQVTAVHTEEKQKQEV